MYFLEVTNKPHPAVPYHILLVSFKGLGMLVASFNIFFRLSNYIYTEPSTMPSPANIDLPFNTIHNNNTITTIIQQMYQ